MEIVTKRLILREHSLDDFDSFWEMINDPVAKKYTGGVTALSYDERLEIYKEDIRQGFSDKGAEFAVTLKDSGEYIGYCGFRYWEEQRVNEMLYGYRQKAWGQGLGFEAALNTLRYLFNEFDCNSYAATADAENIASVRILLRLGFKRVPRESGDDERMELYKIWRKDFSSGTYN